MSGAGGSESSPFSPRVEAALIAALGAHEGQLRKGAARVPYAVHPLHVAWMLRRFTQDEDVLVAALLHDIVEDSADWTHARVRDEFGAPVAAIVAELSEDKSHSWATRKERGIAAVASLSSGAVLVKSCDKLHNLSSLAQDLERAGDADVWGAFNGGKEGTLSVARRLAEALAARAPRALGDALLETVARIERLAASENA